MSFRQFVGLRISTVAGAVPTESDIAEGDLAFNVADGKVFALFGSDVTDITDRYTQGEIDSLLAGKVDKVAGKGLSTHDFTTARRDKLSAVGTLANRNVTISDQPPDPAVGVDGDIWLQHWS